MARDYLAIPDMNFSLLFFYNISINCFIYIATSVPIERAFSGGADLVSKKRCNLGVETIQACMYLKSWWKSGLIND